MMLDSILFLLSLISLMGLSGFLLFRRGKSSRMLWILFLLNLTISIGLFFYTGIDKLNADVSRFIHNSRPKSAKEVYAILFKEPYPGCVEIINWKDQRIPTVDCCIWMELRLCPKELNRILQLRNYDISNHTGAGADSILQSFSQRPAWWRPVFVKDNLYKASFIFNETNRQTIIFGRDSVHVFVCDQAL